LYLQSNFDVVLFILLCIILAMSSQKFHNEIETFIARHEKVLIVFNYGEDGCIFPKKYCSDNPNRMSAIVVSYDMYHGYFLDKDGFFSKLFFGHNNEEHDVYIPIHAILYCKDKNSDDIIFNKTEQGEFLKNFMRPAGTSNKPSNDNANLSLVKTDSEQRNEQKTANVLSLDEFRKKKKGE